MYTSGAPSGKTKKKTRTSTKFAPAKKGKRVPKVSPSGNEPKMASMYGKLDL
jgi:hypothetical protein